MHQIKLPRSIDAERAIFSILLSNPEDFTEIGDKLETKDFYNISSQNIWQAMKDIQAKGSDIDVVSIKAVIQKKGVDPKPAIEELSKCYEEKVMGGNLLNFVQEVKNKSLLRDVITMTYKYLEEAKLEKADALDILVNIEKKVVNLCEKLKDDDAVDVQGILKDVRVDIAKGEADGWQGFRTGFKPLDERTGGFLPKHIWIVGGNTSLGKTFLVLQMFLNVLEQGAKVILFSTEMDRRMTVLRMMGNLAGLGTIDILKGKLNTDEKVRLLKADKTLNDYGQNLLIYDNVYTTEEIRLKIKKQKLKHGVDIIAVDYIQNLRGIGSIYERMSSVATDFQRMAQELDVTVIMASQVTQAAAGWKSGEAIEYKGAGEIAAVADVGIWMQKIDSVEGTVKRRIILRKVRHGMPARCDVQFLFPSGKVIDLGEVQDV